MSNYTLTQIMEEAIKSAKEQKSDLDCFEVENLIFIKLCEELKIDPRNCINKDNFGELVFMGYKIITSLPILTASGND